MTQTDSELKGQAGISFEAAASIGQYTGDFPQEAPDDSQAQLEGMTPDQAIEFIEKTQKKRELQEQSLLQLSDEEDAADSEFVEYTVPNDQQEILEEVFSDKKEPTQHEKFRQRVLERETAAIAKKTNHVHSYPEVESLVEEPAEQIAADSVSGQEAASEDTESSSQKKQIELKSADMFDSAEEVEETLPSQKDRPSIAGEKTTIMVEDKNLLVQKKKSKKGSNKESAKTKQTEAVEEAEAETIATAAVVASEEAQEDKDSKKSEDKSSNEQTVQDTLHARQLDLEKHIQKELVELTDVVNRQYGNSDQKFDYQLVRITDNRPTPVWQTPIKPIKKEETDEEEIERQTAKSTEDREVKEELERQDEIKSHEDEEAANDKAPKQPEKSKQKHQKTAQQDKEEEEEHDNDADEDAQDDNSSQTLAHHKRKHKHHSHKKHHKNNKKDENEDQEEEEDDHELTREESDKVMQDSFKKTFNLSQKKNNKKHG